MDRKTEALVFVSDLLLPVVQILAFVTHHDFSNVGSDLVGEYFGQKVVHGAICYGLGRVKFALTCLLRASFYL